MKTEQNETNNTNMFKHKEMVGGQGKYGIVGGVYVHFKHSFNVYIRTPRLHVNSKYCPFVYEMTVQLRRMLPVFATVRSPKRVHTLLVTEKASIWQQVLT